MMINSILKNKIKTIILLAILSIILMVAGLSISGKFGLILAFIFALTMNVFAYFYSDKIILKMYDAKLLKKDRFGKIYNIVLELTNQFQLPMPKLWLIESNMANAFATGRNPENASIAITTGILEILNERELRAVLSHEISHIKNRDILITTIAATIATAIGYIANIIQYNFFWGSSTEKKRSNNPIGKIMLIVLMPIAATLIQLSISRSREYLADETGAICCKDPLALASALEKLHYNIQNVHLHKEETLKISTASLFIVHPFKAIDWTNLFSTHPTLQKRIEKLKELSEQLK